MVRTRIFRSISGPKLETRIKLEHDLHYVSNFGPEIDLKILVRTIRVY